MSEPKKIVIENLAKDYNPKLAKAIPKFVYKWINKILHVDQVNAFISRTQNDNSLEFMQDTLSELDLKPRFINLDRLKALEGQDKIIFAANHPIGGPEGIALMSEILKYLPNSKIMIQSILSFLEPLNDVAIFNGQRLSTSLDAVKQGLPILIFPSGLCSQRILKHKGIYDFEWKTSFIKIAKRYGYRIQPIYISGQLTKRQYRFYEFRKLFKIVLPIENLYLVDEMYKASQFEQVFTFGDLITPDCLTDDITNEEWAARIRQYTKELSDNPNLSFDPSKPNTLPLVHHFKEDIDKKHRQSKP